MCFTRQNLSRALIAETAIVCYKLLRKSPNSISSPYKRRYKWNNKKLRKGKLDEGDNYSINNGFHSFIAIKNAVYYTRGMYNKYDLWIYKMVIPKGSKYFKNRTQYVSNQIRLASKTPIQSILKKK